MSVAAAAEARLDEGAVEATESEPGRLFEPSGPTLEDRIVATWDELTAAGRVSCPVCSGEMTRGGGCESCGAELG
jgi:hypothetical protein